MNWRLGLTYLGAVLIVTFGAYAEDVGTLITFEKGTTISASEMNDNFADVKAAVNTKKDRRANNGIFIESVSSYTPVAAATDERVVSVSVDTTESARVLATATGYLNVDHSMGSGNFVHMAINETETPTTTSPNKLVHGFPSASVTGSYSVPFTVQEVLDLDGAGTHVIGLDMRFFPDTTQAKSVRLTVVYP